VRNFFTRRRSSGRSRTVYSGNSRGGMRHGSSGGTVEVAIGALIVVVLVLVLLRLVGLI
jgi:predicted metalloprotease